MNTTISITSDRTDKKRCVMTQVRAKIDKSQNLSMISLEELNRMSIICLSFNNHYSFLYDYYISLSLSLFSTVFFPTSHRGRRRRRSSSLNLISLFQS
jgi:hypothetical protein